MKIHDLKPAPGSTRKRKRVGRGIGGKGGKTAGRGTKGQKARGTVPVSFEGGQLPMNMRVPKLRGFNNPFRVEYQAINLDTLEASDLTEVSPETLLEQRPRLEGRARQGARPGRDHPCRHGEGPRLLEVGRGRDHGRRRHRRGASTCRSRCALRSTAAPTPTADLQMAIRRARPPSGVRGVDYRSSRDAEIVRSRVL